MKLFTFPNVDRRTRIEMNGAFYARCWKCGHRSGHHDDTVFTARCRLCPCYITAGEPHRIEATR
jgi:ribosomal protein S27E